MPDYAAMYRRLFQSQTVAIQILQKAQQDTEAMYMDASKTDIPLAERKVLDAAPDGDK